MARTGLAALRRQAAENAAQARGVEKRRKHAATRGKQAAVAARNMALLATEIFATLLPYTTAVHKKISCVPPQSRQRHGG